MTRLIKDMKWKSWGEPKESILALIRGNWGGYYNCAWKS